MLRSWRDIGGAWLGRRVIALDPGSHCLKVLLVEVAFGRLRPIQFRTIDLHAEREQTREEIQEQLRAALDQMGDHPIALALPQHLSLSQIIDLPPANPLEAMRLIEDATVKLSGLSESVLVYDHIKLQPLGIHAHPCWITVCQERDILELLSRLRISDDALYEVTSSANALTAAYRAQEPGADRVVLIDFGAASSVLAIMVAGQGVYAASFPIGGDGFTEALAAAENCSFETAEKAKRSRNLFAGTDALPAVQAKADEWGNQVERILNEWLEDYPELQLTLQSFRVVLSGGSMRQPGLADYLKSRASLNFTGWPVGTDDEDEFSAAQFAVASGTALQALRKNPQPASLLPFGLLQARQQDRSLRRFQLGQICLLLLIGLVLAFGTWKKFALLHDKTDLLAYRRSSREKVHLLASVTGQLARDYKRLTPVLEGQQQTLDTLKTLSMLQQARSNAPSWFVLFADPKSYYSSKPLVEQTNQPPPAANVPPALVVPPFPRGFIAEICLPEDGEAMRQATTRLVAHLKQPSFFRKVDLLSADLRRNLADPKTVMPDHLVSLVLELPESEWGMALESRKNEPAPADKGKAKSIQRPVGPKPKGEAPSSSPKAP